MKKKLWAAVMALLMGAMCAQFAFGAQTTVLVGSGGLRFNPTNVVIASGDSVIWSWVGIDHSTTSGTNGNHGDDLGSTNGLWDSGIITTLPHSFTNTFFNFGTFSYYCTVHSGLGMTGQVIVAGASIPPTVGITSPQFGAVFAAPANVLILAGATNGNSVLANVEFLSDATVVASQTTGPFFTTVNNLTAGNHTLTAIATDNDGSSATNSVIISVVTPVPVSLANPFTLSGTHFQFSYSVNTGLQYVVQSSTNLTAWTPLVTNTASSNPIVFTDGSATNSLNFYRVGLLPNP